MTATEEDDVSHITVWTAPNCPGCKSTLNFFKTAGVPVQTRDLSAPENRQKLEALRAADIKQAPYVETPTDAWSGLRADKILSACNEYRAHSPSPATAGPTQTQEVST